MKKHHLTGLGRAMRLRHWLAVGMLAAASFATACNRPHGASSRTTRESAPAAAETAAAATSSSAPAPIVSEPGADLPGRVLDPRADEVLRAMSAFLASSTNFAFEAEETYDELPDGQPRMMLSNRRRVAVARPNRFAADVEGDSLNRSVWFDGKTLSTLDRTTLTYAKIDASLTIDGALDLLSDKYAIAVPIGDLIYADPYNVLTEAVTYSRYLGIHQAAGRPCHHLVFAQPTIEWQLWVDSGDKPIPRKLVITYAGEPGEPQYAAVITKWTTPSALPAELFTFEAPDGAVRVDQSALVPHLPGSPR